MAAAGTACAFVHRRHPGRVGCGDGWVADETWICSERAESLFIWSINGILSVPPVPKIPSGGTAESKETTMARLPPVLTLPFYFQQFAKNTWTPFPWEDASKTRYLQTLLQNLPSPLHSTLTQGLRTPPALALYRSGYIGRAIRSPLRKVSIHPSSQTSWLRGQRCLQCRGTPLPLLSQLSLASPRLLATLTRPRSSPGTFSPKAAAGEGQGHQLLMKDATRWAQSHRHFPVQTLACWGLLSWTSEVISQSSTSCWKAAHYDSARGSCFSGRPRAAHSSNHLLQRRQRDAACDSVCSARRGGATPSAGH